jgi:3-oxoacyl-[acyl-carrier protein] reductase
MRRLLARGATVIAIDRDEAALEAAVAEDRSSTGDVTGLPLDVTRQDHLDEAFRRIAAEFPPVRALVNAVGITGQTGRPCHEVDCDDFRTVVAVNLVSAFLLTRAVVPMMLPNRYGRILHVASIAGKEGNAGMAAYSATKAGLIGLVKSAAKDYADTGVTINALAPAVIHTDLVASMPEHQVRYMTDKIPMKRTGKLEEAAAMIEFIISPECAFTTGFTFDLSGGRATY